MSGMSEQVWRGSQIEAWDAASTLAGFKVGPVERPSTLPEFWNEAQAEKWAEDGFPPLPGRAGEFPEVVGFAFLDDEYAGVVA